MKYFEQTDRGLIKLEGGDRYNFLQGLITNDIHQLSDKKSMYSALLTPQGRFLHDFFVYENGDQIYLDLSADRLEDLLKRLQLYKLRSNVSISSSITSVYCYYDIHKDSNGLVEQICKKNKTAYLDPRLSILGIRSLAPIELSATNSNIDDYEVFRLTHGIPETGKDLIAEKSIILECGLDELNAIDWHKGCYLGQELMARTKHRGMVHNRLFPVELEGEIPEYLSPIQLNNQKVGTIYSINGNRGIAKVRIEALEAFQNGQSLSCGNAKIKPYAPSWMKI